MPAMQSHAVASVPPNGTAAALEQPLTRQAATPQFERFGEWGQQVAIVRDGSVREVACQLATSPQRRTSTSDELWSACQTAMPLSFRNYQIVRLDAPSFFLPAGEVVFTVTENPMQLPDNPPQGVMMRHIEAMNAHPHAKFYLLEPVFTSEPYFHLYSAEELREEANGDRQAAARIARQFGWSFRSADWARARARDAAGAAIRMTAACVERLAKQFVPRSRGRLSRSDLARLLREGSQTDVVIERWAQVSEARSLDDDRRRLKRAIDELRWRASIDPVLCFELPDSPGDLWFESHWFTGADGKRYVHY